MRSLLLDDPRICTYQLDAWMPEKIAVMKMQGFVKDVGGEILTSVPGHIRVQLLDEMAVAQQPSAGLLSWLGLVQPPPSTGTVLADTILLIRPAANSPRPAYWASR